MCCIQTLLLLAVLAAAAACRAAGPSASASNAVPSPAATPPAVTAPEADRATVLRQFLSRPIRGSRPFAAVTDYLAWLQQRPGTDTVTTDATPDPSGDWRITMTLTADDGRVVTAGCRYGAAGRFATTGLFWTDCVELAGLWTVLAPTSFGTMAEARPFLAPVAVFLPMPPPGSFAVERVTLPETTERAWSNPFVVGVIFTDAGGIEVTLLQQPAGLNGPVFPEYQTCSQGHWPAIRPCRSWASMGAYFLLHTTTGDAALLHAFETAIDPRRP